LKRIEVREVDNSSVEQGMGTKTCCSGATSLEIESSQIAIGSDTGVSSSVKEQMAKVSCKSDDTASIEVKPAYENMNSASQNTVMELLSEKELEDVPPIPNTSVQFLRAWKRVRASPQFSYCYLKVCY
jgi:hypothetical protein